MSNNNYFFENITSVFRFGKHRNESLWSVISEDESYVYWCINNIYNFSISKETLEQIKNLFPMFIITQDFSRHIRELQDFENDEEESCFDDDTDDWHNSYDDGWCNYDNHPTYERYGGSYAQDEMGYSDDEIDIIFDGDPDAYWNID